MQPPVAEATPTANADPGSPAYRGLVLGLLFLMMMSHSIDRSITGILAQPIKQALNLSDLQLGLLGGLSFALLYVVMGIPLARISERQNRVTVMSVCLATWSLMTTLCGLASSFVMLLLFRAGVGIGEAGGGPAAQAVISDYYPASRRTSALSVFSLGIPVGAMVGTMLGGVVADAYGWRTAFFVMGLPGIALAVLMKLTVQEPRRGMSDSAAMAASAANPPPSLWATVRYLWSCVSLRVFVTGVILTGFAANGIAQFQAAYFLRRFDVTLGEVGLATGLLTGISMVAGTLAGGFLSDWAGKRDRRWYAWLPALGTAISAPLYALIYLQESWGAAMAVMWLPGLFQYLYLAPALSLTQNLAPPRMRATAVAVLTLVSSIITMGLGPVAIGALSDLLAANTFGGAMDACQTKPAGDLAVRCVAASGAGVQQAMIAATSLYAVAALCYALAALRIRQDLDRADRGGL